MYACSNNFHDRSPDSPSSQVFLTNVAGGSILIVDTVPVMLSAKSGRLSTWPSTLTRDDLERLQWKPVPLREFIFKVHSRCNLACKYCYIYEMEDDSWHDQPGAMSLQVAEQAAIRIAEHAEKHEIPAVVIMLHGGEPLLLGNRRLTDLLEVISRTLEPVTTPVFRMQTNGLLLTAETLEILDEFSVDVGVSLDGGREANDRHRQRRNGTGSYYTVAERLRSFAAGPYSHLYWRILAAIDVANDPIDVYTSIRAFRPPHMDFLFPHANWQTPPAERSDDDPTPYADWLIKIFDHWFDSPVDEPGIRLFDQIIRLLQGQTSAFEVLGLEPVALATIQTDGSFELVDTLKSAYNSAAFTGLDVFNNDIDELLPQPSVAARQIGINGVSDQCRACDEVDVCGGGYYPHRYSKTGGFLNPSVYCADLYRLICYIRTRIT
jgi:uncharacterized protein